MSNYYYAVSRDGLRASPPGVISRFLQLTGTLCEPGLTENRSNRRARRPAAHRRNGAKWPVLTMMLTMILTLTLIRSLSLIRLSEFQSDREHPSVNTVATPLAGCLTVWLL
eukprot:2552373-Prymnesium_polylepis.1